MKHRYNRIPMRGAWMLCAALLASGCADRDLGGNTPGGDNPGLITLSGEISQINATRANDAGFADGDQIGVYIVDYAGNNPGTLLSYGNRADNARHTFNEKEWRWASDYDIYWKDKTTKIDVYGYYPYSAPDNVNAYSFEVEANQLREAAEGEMGAYEASDFLWGKAEGIAPTERAVMLSMGHCMANARVTLIEGSGFEAGEWAALDKTVSVTNTLRNATIDLSTGTVTPTGKVQGSIIPSKRGDEWRAIVVPQTVEVGKALFNISIDGLPYRFSKGTDFEYVAGKMNNFGIRVDRKGNKGDYTLTLISESITPWENDLISHDATAKEYVIINVPEAGGLEKAIADANKDLTRMRNMKVTGEINGIDIGVMRHKMTMLTALNLKEVVIKKSGSCELDDNPDWHCHECFDDELPENAFYGKESLTNFVFPDKLKRIGVQAFCDCFNISGSLILPEGLEVIEKAAFRSCYGYGGAIYFPSTLKRLGDAKGYSAYWDGIFAHCNFCCELQLPEGLEIIGCGTFNECKNLYGDLHLPGKLKFLGEGAFGGCENLKGDIVIPAGVTVIPPGCFDGTWMGGNLTLHDGITAIGGNAFANAGLRGELHLPQHLEAISEGAFYNNDFSGELILPKGVSVIGDKCFAYNWRLMGILEIPENVLSIGAGAFAQCRSLEGVIFPEALENIRHHSGWGEDAGAFQNCFGIGKIVCKGTVPPYITPGAFDGVAKDNFTLEVPEGSIIQYQTAPGWMDFKRISAHHELVCRPAVACAIGSERRQTLVIDAEGEWDVQSIPSWCSLSKTSGFKKTELTLTISSFDETYGSREGDIVFRLKGKDYTHSCHVTQHGYQYAEDEWLPLQKATKGNNGGINIVMLGDGYNSENIADGTYLADMQMQMENFFGIEPYTTYRDYFNVYTAFPVSIESGVGSVNTIRYNRFNTTFTGGVGLRCDYDELIDYILKSPTVNESNIDRTLVVMVPNSNDYGGICMMWESGFAVAFCPKSNYGYPLDTRGVIQHEAGGHGFGKLGDEYIYHNAFIDNCGCRCCGHVMELMGAKAMGWFENLELTGKTHQVGWSHLIYDPRYSDIVDVFEGGYMHTRGVFRSEQNSCMNNDIPYYSTISRESIVRRIKQYAGEEFSFEEFAAKDKKTPGTVTRTLLDASGTPGAKNMPPVIRKGSPLKRKRN